MLVHDILTNDYRLLTELSTANHPYEGVYASDLLSVVLRSASQNAVLITIIANLNTIAVAMLMDLPAIIFSENQVVTQAMIEKANLENIALISTSLKTHEVILDLKARNCL